MESISDIAAYLHSIDVGASASATFNPKSVLVGNAAAGKAYFNGKGHCTAWPIQTRQAESRRSPWLEYDRWH